MKKLLLLLLCVPLLFSCGEKEEKNEKKERTTMEQKAIDECTIAITSFPEPSKYLDEESVPKVIQDLLLKDAEEICSCAIENGDWQNLSIQGIANLCGSEELQRKIEVWVEMIMDEKKSRRETRSAE
ncbi:hypothetical protein OAJ56_00215 [Flavobacteriales bacterium]|nr:hypothetical protein [Flavobacteriales bacterium]